MMKRFFVILIGCLWLAVPLFAQSNKLIRELESKRGALQKQIAESETRETRILPLIRHSRLTSSMAG